MGRCALLLPLMPMPLRPALCTVRVDRVEPEEADSCDAASLEVMVSSEQLSPGPSLPLLPALLLLSLSCRLPIPGRCCADLLSRPAGRMTESIPNLFLLFFNTPLVLLAVGLPSGPEAPAAEDEDWEEADVPTIIWLCVNDDRPAELEREEEEQLSRRCRCRCRC